MNTNSMKEPDLQEMLQADTQGVRAREMLSVIEKSSRLVGSRLRGQHASSEFKAAEQLTQALDATDRVVRKVWESLHGRHLV
jgi:hypothetical protein